MKKKQETRHVLSLETSNSTEPRYKYPHENI